MNLTKDIRLPKKYLNQCPPPCYFSMRTWLEKNTKTIKSQSIVGQGDISIIGLLGGKNYVFVRANGTPTENAQELQAAYNEAVSRTPTNTDRQTVLAAKGYYDFGSTPFTMDTDFVNLVSLDGNRSVIFNSNDLNGTIVVDTSNILVKGVDTTVENTKPFTVNGNLSGVVIENCKGGFNSFGTASTGGNQNATFIDCEAGGNSFNGQTLDGTYISCKAGNNSFGSFANSSSSITNITINATFINCVGGNFCFGTRPNLGSSPVNITISGAKFENCKANNNSFGFFTSPQITTLTINNSEFLNCESLADSFIASPISAIGSTMTVSNTKFTDCISKGRFSFGVTRSNAILTINQSTTFENCTSFENSFAAKGNSNINSQIILNSVNFINCKTYQQNSNPLVYGNNSFGYLLDDNNTSPVTNCIFENCKAGNNSFCFINVSPIVLSVLIDNVSKFINCEGGNNCFGHQCILFSFLKNCIAIDNSFAGQSGEAKGTFIDCKAGDESFGGNIGNASGTFTNCQGGEASFGGKGVTSGIFTNCQGSHKSFGGNGTAFGTFTNCQGGDYSFGGDGTASGTFNSCVGGDESFGGNSGVLTGKLYYCRLTTGTFQTPTVSGTIVLGVDGTNTIINL